MEIDKNYKKPKCPHNRYKTNCIDCGGGSICQHKKQKIYCKDCGGNAICEHNRVKYSCKDCKGSNICEHNKRKRLCVECKGSGICIHNKRQNSCKICDIRSYLIKLQRDCVRRILKTSTKIIKNKTTLEYIDCSIENFRIFIFNKMKSNMNINNIHLDHIKPVSCFNLDNETEFKECCHYTNFQPLLIEDNLKKSNNWSEKDDLFWRNNIIFNNNYIDIYIPFKSI